MRAFLCIVFGLLAGLASAEPRLLTAEEHGAWQAIGRVNQAGFKSRSLCTGTLIAPDRVLTAAHCVDPTRSDPVVFVAGWYRGARAAVREAVEIHVARGFVLGVSPSHAQISVDWALLTLDAPITDITPLPFKGRKRGQPVDLIAYSASRPHALSARGPCEVTAARGAVLTLGCRSEPGNSGGPVLMRAEGGWRVVGVVSAATRTQTDAVVPGRAFLRLIR
ncbi:trypsin-like serine peptidase [Roseobacteraceae bacterium S113]